MAHLLPLCISIISNSHQTLTALPITLPSVLSFSVSLAVSLLLEQGNPSKLVDFLCWGEFLFIMAGTGVFADILDGDVYKYYDDGEWKKSSSGKTVAIINPTTRKTQYKVQG